MYQKFVNASRFFGMFIAPVFCFVHTLAVCVSSAAGSFTRSPLTCMTLRPPLMPVASAEVVERSAFQAVPRPPAEPAWSPLSAFLGVMSVQHRLLGGGAAGPVSEPVAGSLCQVPLQSPSAADSAGSDAESSPRKLWRPHVD